MAYKTKILIALLVVICILSIPFVAVHGAGGRIEGKVTDPKGAAITGAAITIIDPITNQKFNGLTDDQGRYKIEGLPPGLYKIVVSAKGFNDGRRENIKVDDGGVVPVDLRLEIAPLEAEVEVLADSKKANSDPVYQQLRTQAKNEQDFTGERK